MTYVQLTAEERFTIATLRSQYLSDADIGAILRRHRTTIWRERKRNCAPSGCGYGHERAHERAGARRKRSRRNQHFGAVEFSRVETLLRELWSPEQISGYLRLTGELSISHETIYRHIWRNRRRGGTLYTHLRWKFKPRRKRYGRYDSRGRLAGKRHISERPGAVENRGRVGHWEIDTVMGKASDCVVTLVERKTGFILIGKLRARTMQECLRATVMLMRRHPGRFQTITSDNGTEFHAYADIEAKTGVLFYFATPHHAWERATNENTNGLLRQYLPKRLSMVKVTQSECDAIADQLNNRPRKRHAYRTPYERFTLK